MKRAMEVFVAIIIVVVIVAVYKVSTAQFPLIKEVCQARSMDEIYVGKELKNLYR